jgi:hypothetical protein
MMTDEKDQVGSNPYRPPQAEVRDFGEPIFEDARLELLASGQKRVILAIGVYLALVFLRVAVNGFLTLAPQVMSGVVLIGMLAALKLSLTGWWRIGLGLKTPGFARVLLGVCLLLPLVNVLVLLIASGRATRALRKGGYHVGFLGASKV